MHEKIKTLPNPDNRKNWAITIEIHSPSYLSLCFIPDKLIADHNDIKEKLAACLREEWDCPEEAMLNIIEFFNNALVPIWLEITYKSEGCIIKVEDRQPGIEIHKNRLD